jgi:broad specificity phosphatase PhoE
MRRTLAVLFLLFIAAAALATQPAAPTTVILVRHAEKAKEPADDPPLTETGAERARELARVIGSAGISTIYTTPWARTRQTAGPLSEALKLTPVEVKTGPQYAAELAARLKSAHPGETVLVVGHSNTTQQVIRALGIADAPSIADSQHDDLFIVTLPSCGEPQLITLRYGAVSR